MGVVKEGADLLGHFRAEGMFNLAGVLVERVFIDAKRFVEKAFREAMPAEYMPRASLPTRGKRKRCAFQVNQALPRHQQERGPIGRELRQGVRFQNAAAAIFLRMPDGLQQVIDQLLFISGEDGNLCKPPVVKLATGPETTRACPRSYL